MMTNKLWGPINESERPGGLQNGRGIIRGDEVKRQGQTKLWSGDNAPDLELIHISYFVEGANYLLIHLTSLAKGSRPSP